MFSIANLLFVYMFVVFIGFIFLFFNLYHLSRYGLNDRKTYIIMALYVVSFLIVLAGSIAWLSIFDWSVTIDFNGNMNNNLINTF